MRAAYSLATSTVTHNLQEGSNHDHSSSLLCLSVSKSCLTYHRYLKCEQLINKWSSKTTATTTKAIQSKNKSARAASAALSAAVLSRPEVRSRKSAHCGSAVSSSTVCLLPACGDGSWSLREENMIQLWQSTPRPLIPCTLTNCDFCVHATYCARNCFDGVL